MKMLESIVLRSYLSAEIQRGKFHIMVQIWILKELDNKEKIYKNFSTFLRPSNLSLRNGSLLKIHSNK